MVILHPHKIMGKDVDETDTPTDAQVLTYNDSKGQWDAQDATGGSGGHTIQDEGVDLTQRTNLNFVGSVVTVTDDAGNDATVVTLSGAGEANTTSNSGAGEGLALAKSGVDLPFKSITATDSTVTLTGSATELDVKVTNPFTAADETKLDGIEALADVTDATNVDAAGAVMNTDASTAAMSFVIDEDSMTTNSATKVPTQQSVKAYVDNKTRTENYTIPLTMTVPEGTVCYPEIHTLATAGAKVSGMVLPNGASTSTFNFKGVVPKNLAGTPAMAIRVRIMTMGAVAGPADVRLTVKTVGIADTESLDTALTAETESTVTMPTATETMDYYEQDLTTDWAASDTIIGQITRDPTDVADDFTDDILIVGVDLVVTRSLS